MQELSFAFIVKIQPPILKNEKIAKEHYGIMLLSLCTLSFVTVTAVLKSTSLAIEIAKETGARIHIMHISTKEEVQMLNELKFGNVVTRQISGEACIPHLFF